MTNLWTVCYFTLGITLTGGMLLLFKKIFQDKLSARWHYLVWLVLLVRVILPADLRLFSTGFALNTLWMEGMKRIRGVVEMGRDSLLSTPFGMGGGELSLLKDAPVGAWSLTDRLFVVYLAGVAAVLLYDIAIYGKLRREIGKGREASPALWEKIRTAEKKYDLPQQERVKVCEGLETPFLCGFIRPILVIPAEQEETVDEKVLLHEMLHLKHHDVLVNIALHLLQALQWFNPFIYGLCRVIRNDSEALCDQRALERLEGEEKREYGLLLLGMADHRCPSRIGTTSMANGTKNIKTRVQRIADFGRAPKGAAFATACITVMLCLASVSFAYEPKYFDTSGVENQADLERLLEEAQYFEVPSPEMAISIFYEAIYEKNLGKLALTVPQEEFEAYRAWALQEYKNGENYGAQLTKGTKAEYKYKFYEDIRLDDVSLFDRQADGALIGMITILDGTEARYNDVPVTERYQYFRVFEESKKNWAVEPLQEESWLFDINDPHMVTRKLRERMEQGDYVQIGDWKMTEAAYCEIWPIGYSGGTDFFSQMYGNTTERQFQKELGAFAVHEAYLEYTGTAFLDEKQALVVFTCPAEMTDEELMQRTYPINSGGSSSAGYEWEVIRIGEEWDGILHARGDQYYETLEEAFSGLREPYEVRIYTRDGERLETFPLKGGALYEENR